MRTVTSKALPPIPEPDEVSAPFWDAAAREELRIQRCRRSGRFMHPPQRLCLCCGEDDLEFAPVSGKGTIYSFTVMRDQRVQGFTDRVPYISAFVELDEQPLLILVCNLLGAREEDVEIGRRVEVAFERLTPEITLPQFRLAG